MFTNTKLAMNVEQLKAEEELVESAASFIVEVLIPNMASDRTRVILFVLA